MDPLSWLQFGTGLLGGWWQNAKEEEAAKWERENQARVEGGFTERLHAAQQILKAGQEDLSNQLTRNQIKDSAMYDNLSAQSIFRAREANAKLMDASRSAGQELVKGYQGRYDRGMGMLEGMGEQEKKDIAEQYAGLAGQTKQRMTDAGLGGSTVSSSMLSGVKREETNARGRLQERLRAQKVAADAGLSGDVLNAQAASAAQNLGLMQATTADEQAMMRNRSDMQYNLASGQRAQRLGMNADFANNYLNTTVGLSGDVLNYAANRAYPVTQNNPLLVASNALGNWQAMKVAKQQADAMQSQADNAWWQSLLGGTTGMIAGGGAMGLGWGLTNPTAV